MYLLFATSFLIPANKDYQSRLYHMLIITCRTVTWCTVVSITARSLGRSFIQSSRISNVAPLHRVVKISTTLGSKVNGDAMYTTSWFERLYISLTTQQHAAKLTRTCSATTYANNVALPAFTHCMPAVQQSINIYCLPGPQQQTCSSGFAAVVPCWDRQINGWTDRQTDVPFHRPCSTYYAGSAKTFKN